MATMVTRAAAPPQNWVLTPAQDALYIIAAPPLVLALAIAAFAMLGAESAAALIILVHVVLTVAHHMPTFIRVYGDVDLFRRFKWNFLLAPLLPLGISAAVLAYIDSRGLPVENFLYLFILLALWDPWHFLMQHYGFMRIYDRHNAAPQRLAARMDLLLAASWFVTIMLASSAWLPGILQDLFADAAIPLVLKLPTGLVALATAFMQIAAVAATAVYAGYLLWCRRHGHYVSLAKLALCLTTFGVMYLSYTPNAWIREAAPGWSFKVGFATVGIVHMTQYLAIVWRYNRTLATRPGRARAGWFQRLHARGGWLAGFAYVGVCLGYGALLTGRHDNRLLMSVLMAVGFTSTLLHYYFDGFIWKMRHRQNRENLLAEPPPSAAASRTPVGTAAATAADIGADRGVGSWWSSGVPRPAARVLLRHALYFGVPMAVLTCGAVSVWNGPGMNYVGHMLRAQTLQQAGQPQQAVREARVAFASMDRQLLFARRMALLQPTPAREAALALLIYNHSQYHELLLPALAGRPLTRERLALRRAHLQEAVGLLQAAVDGGGELAHPGHEKLTAVDARHLLDHWRSELARLEMAEAEMGEGGA
jgi:hypothetical protein